MYKSPIDMFVTDIMTQIEKQTDDEIYKAVASIGINVDKYELIRALRYDRNQYNVGYMEGKAAAMPKWIPVTEGLPEKEVAVLCRKKNGDCWVAEWSFCDDQLWTDHEAWASETEVTHWMPLPEPPKGE